MLRLEDMIRTLRESHLMRWARMSIRARWVLPFCLAISSRFVLRIQLPLASVVSISLRTCSCQGKSGIPIISHNCFTSSSLLLPLIGIDWMRGLVAPRSTLDRLAGIGLILDWFGCERTVLVDYRLCRREEARKNRGGTHAI